MDRRKKGVKVRPGDKQAGQKGSQRGEVKQTHWGKKIFLKFFSGISLY